MIYRVNAAMKRSIEIPVRATTVRYSTQKHCNSTNNNNQTVVRKLAWYYNFPILVDHRVSYWTFVWNCIHCLQ